MKLAQPKSFAIFKTALLSSLITISGSLATQVRAENTHPQIVAQASPTVQFYCGKAADPSSRSNLPATLARVSGSREEPVLIIWKSEAFKTTPQQRCETVSPKFQTALQQGRNYITAGVDRKSGMGIICAMADAEQPCDRRNMLFTLKSYQDAGNTIEQLSSVLRGTASSPIYESGSTPVVDLRDFALLRKN
ncbi:COP23 domain-containing protein [Chamaesiphon sp. OTE_20_metabat_361]|uniref:COP23 domain-containing protein n=1 Tax=Chamaesiphon sp. OTE_20_metabat_361 TaxID=2964689 RepID=UPI00286B55E8|nr:COP23 domain-containing protein [Chamaesiphon sp. OTE_20_metabat_361]